MPESFPIATKRTLDTPYGPVIGTSTRWANGQYCALLTARGVVGCGIFDIATCDEFKISIAICRGTVARPLVEPEDLYDAKIVAVSKLAAEYGVKEGMTGLEAVGVLLGQ